MLQVRLCYHCNHLSPCCHCQQYNMRNSLRTGIQRKRVVSPKKAWVIGWPRAYKHLTIWSNFAPFLQWCWLSDSGAYSNVIVIREAKVLGKALQNHSYNSSSEVIVMITNSLLCHFREPIERNILFVKASSGDLVEGNRDLNGDRWKS